MPESPKSIFRQAVTASDWLRVLRKRGYTVEPIEAGQYTEHATMSAHKDIADVDGHTIRIEIEDRNKREGAMTSAYRLSAFVQSDKHTGWGWSVINHFYLPFGRWELLDWLENHIKRHTNYDQLYKAVWDAPTHLDNLDHIRFEAQQLAEQLLHESPEFKTLKANTRTLTPEERQAAGEAAIRKSVVKGKTWYWSATHRCYQVRPTLKAAITAYWKIVEPSG